MLSPHRNVLIFTQECINLQKGSLRYKMSLNFILKGCLFCVCVKRFWPIIRVANNSQEKFIILHVPLIGFLCYSNWDEILLYGSWLEKYIKDECIHLFQKRLSERNGERRMLNRGCTTEKNCAYAIWYAKFHKLRSPYGKMNTPTMNVCLRVLDSEDKRDSSFLQLEYVPRFLVWTAYCLRLYIASYK